MNAKKWLSAAIAVFALTAGGVLAAPKTKKGKSGPPPSSISRSNKAPSAYHVFIEPAKDKAKAGSVAVKAADAAMNKAFTRPGYIINTPAEGAPTESEALAKWLRDKDRTGLKLDLTVEELKESQDNGSTRFDAKMKATVYTTPSGWLVMSTTGEAGALSDGMMLDKDLQAAAIEAATTTLVENIANHLAKKPVPIDR